MAPPVTSDMRVFFSIALENDDQKNPTKNQVNQVNSIRKTANYGKGSEFKQRTTLGRDELINTLANGNLPGIYAPHVLRIV